MDSELLLELLLQMRKAPPGSQHAELYIMWKAAICRQMSWTPKNFEDRMSKAMED